MFDLLSTLPESMAVMDQVTPLTVHEDPEYGVYVKGLSCHLAQNEEEALNLLFEVSDLLLKGSHLFIFIINYVTQYKLSNVNSSQMCLNEPFY